jgi:hypothetical protein
MWVTVLTEPTWCNIPEAIKLHICYWFLIFRLPKTLAQLVTIMSCMRFGSCFTFKIETLCILKTPGKKLYRDITYRIPEHRFPVKTVIIRSQLHAGMQKLNMKADGQTDLGSLSCSYFILSL